MIENNADCRGAGIAIVSKPADVINAMAAESWFNLASTYIICADNPQRCRAVEAVLRGQNLTHVTAISPCLYSILCSKAASNNRYRLLMLAILSLALGASWRNFANWENRRRFRRLKTAGATLITDLWRTKIEIAASLDWSSLVIIDGGLSTRTLGLMPVNNRRIREVISDYQDAQRSDHFNPVRCATARAIQKGLRGYLYSAPSEAVEFVIRKSELMAPTIFSIYAENQDFDSPIKVIRNELSNIIDIVNSKKDGEEIWIVGHPELRHVENQVNLALQIGGEQVYFVHPRDGNKLWRNPDLRARYAAAARQFGFRLRVDEEPLEWALINSELRPKALVTYRGSSIVGYMNRLGLNDKIRFVSDHGL